MIKSLAVMTLVFLVSIPTANAQPGNLPAVQQQLTIFAGILEESLKLNESTGLFGMSLGGVEPIYLQGQGALFEIRSPLANRRNRMGLASLSSAMQALQMRQNPFELMRRNLNQAAGSTSERSADSDSGNSAYSQLLDRIAAIDYSTVARNAMQQASQSARALQALGDLDDAGFNQLNAEIAEMGQTLESYLERLRNLELEVREQISMDENATNEDELGARLESLLQGLEPIKDQALARAGELREQAARAEREFAEQWQKDLVEFRDSLYQTLCEYGGTLQDLPEAENVSIVLKGLGEDRADNRRTDQIHIVSKSLVLACARGEIDAIALQARASSYTY